MAGPRHLWSGDWLRESAAVRERMSQRRAPAPVADDEPQEGAGVQSTGGPLAGARAALRRIRAAIGAAAARAAGWRPGARGTLATLGRYRARLLTIALIAGLTGAGVTVAAEALAGGSTNRIGSQPWLGVELTPSLGQPGAAVAFVFPGGPADRAGLEPGDVITAVGARAVSGPAELVAAIAALHAGTREPLHVERLGQQVVIDVTLGVRSASAP